MPQLEVAHGDPLLRIDPWTALADGRGQLMRVLDDLDETGASLPLDLPEDARGARWLVGDLVTHLASWDELIASTLHAVAQGATGPEVTAQPDHEWAAWNAHRVAEGRSTQLAERLERLDLARRELLRAGSVLDDEPFDMPVATAWGVEESPRGMLIVQAMHDGMHAEAIAIALGLETPSPTL